MRTLSFAAAGFASSDAPTVYTLAGIGRTPDVPATSAGVFKLDVQSADDAFAVHIADNAATNATKGIGFSRVYRVSESAPQIRIFIVVPSEVLDVDANTLRFSLHLV